MTRLYPTPYHLPRKDRCRETAWRWRLDELQVNQLVRRVRANDAEPEKKEEEAQGTLEAIACYAMNEQSHLTLDATV